MLLSLFERLINVAIELFYSYVPKYQFEIYGFNYIDQQIVKKIYL